jgi:hypothetical protein
MRMLRIANKYSKYISPTLHHHIMCCKETMSLMKFTSIKKRTRDFNPFQKERKKLLFQCNFFSLLF